MKKCFHCGVSLTAKNTDERSFGTMGDMEYNECIACQDQMDTMMRQFKEEPHKLEGMNLYAGGKKLTIRNIGDGDLFFDGQEA